MAKQHSQSTPVWHLSRGMDRRFRSGHPWVYSNELKESPKGIEPGSLVELRDPSGKFLARGFGNPKSLIAFRSLSRVSSDLNPDSKESIIRALERAGKLRTLLGFSPTSYRLCFGEADGIPGLVIDRYATLGGQVFVAQAHTAGANRMISFLPEVLEAYTRSVYQGTLWDRTSIVLRNDLGVRKLEGLEEEAPQILRQRGSEDLARQEILIRAVLGGAPLNFQVDLIKGQKTGFFLDQFANIQLAAIRFKDFFTNPDLQVGAQMQGRAFSKINILDLCCYVGQWGAQFARVFKDIGIDVEVTAVDASSQALEFAKRNVEFQGAQCKTLKGNVLKDLSQFDEQSFDIVISDPPALIKSRKDIPIGTHAYLQLATQALRLVKKGGGIVTCSCSALLEEESFAQVLSKAVRRSQVEFRWIGKGAQSPDHPMLIEFPEGRYLKSWMGIAID